MFLLGFLLLLLGVFSASYYVVNSKVAYKSATLSVDVSLVAGLFFILFGFILTLSSAKIPQIRLPGD